MLLWSLTMVRRFRKAHNTRVYVHHQPSSNVFSNSRLRINEIHLNIHSLIFITIALVTAGLSMDIFNEVHDCSRVYLNITLPSSGSGGSAPPEPSIPLGTCTKVHLRLLCWTLCVFWWPVEIVQNRPKSRNSDKMLCTNVHIFEWFWMISANFDIWKLFENSQ